MIFSIRYFVSLVAVVLASIATVTAFTTTKITTTTTTKTSFISLPAKIDGRTIENGTVVPTNNFLLVKVAPNREETEGGILLTGKAKLVKTKGTVVSVGPGKTHPDTGELTQGMPVAAGDQVVYGEFDGTELDIDGDKHTLIRDDDVLVKYQGEELTLESCEAVRDSVLVFIETKETATDGGILLAATSISKSKPSTGKVVKVGPGRFATNGKQMEMEVQEGDYIKFRDFAGNEIEIGDEEYTVVHPFDILAKF